MSGPGRHSLSCAVVLLLVVGIRVSPQPAMAQSTIAVLPVNYGFGSASSVSNELASALQRFHTAECVAVVAPDPPLGGRYGSPEPVDLEWVSLEVIRGENAYYEMDLDEAVSILQQDDLTALWDHTVEMAVRPEFGAIIRRGILALARVYFQQGDIEHSAATIRESLRRFPLWTPTVDWYQPEFVDQYLQVRDDFHLDLPRVRIETPGAECRVFINGQEVEAAVPPIEVPLARGRHALVVECGNRRSRVHLVSSQERQSVYINPRFDDAWSPESGELTVPRDESHDPAVLGPMARAYGDLVGADRAVLVGWVEPTNTPRMVQIAVFDTGSEALEYAFRAPSGTDSEVLLAALASSGSIEEVQPFTAGGWLMNDRWGGGGGHDILGWSLVGLGCASLLLGTVFAVIEDGAYDDFVECDADPVCRNSDDLRDHRRSGETAATFSFIGLGVGLAASIAGVIVLLVDSSPPEQPERQARSWRIGPDAVGGFTARGGGGASISWAF